MLTPAGCVVIAVVMSLFGMAAAQQPQPATESERTKRRLTAAQRLSLPGPEDKELAATVGIWNVVSTLCLTPDAQPIVTRNLVADRTMIGNYLHEIMKPVPVQQYRIAVVRKNITAN